MCDANDLTPEWWFEEQKPPMHRVHSTLTHLHWIHAGLVTSIVQCKLSSSSHTTTICHQHQPSHLHLKRIHEKKKNRVYRSVLCLVSSFIAIRSLTEAIVCDVDVVAMRSLFISKPKRVYDNNLTKLIDIPHLISSIDCESVSIDLSAVPYRALTIFILCRVSPPLISWHCV